VVTLAKKVLITGITGQDGSYLAELLLSKGYEVHGLKRRTSVVSTGRLAHLLQDVHLADGDLGDAHSLSRIVQEVQPDEVYNLAAQSFVKTSFVQPELTGNITGLGAARLLEAIRRDVPRAKYYQASSSEMFGSAPPPQNENSPFHPRSPYGCAKMYAYWMTINYRESYNIHASNGILFNHESPRRGIEFVTQKIVTGIASILAGKSTNIALGNLEARRDWGHARDFVEAMWLMLQQDAPDDYVVATGETHTVREFCELAFSRVNLDYKKYVIIDPQYYRPAEVDVLLGDATKAQRRLGWMPKTTFKDLVYEMVDSAVRQSNETEVER
jgi:GDPmannose 4,6-dehydratase